MTTYSKAGYFGWAGGGKDGAIVDMWLQSRFAQIPAFNSAPPVGSPDAGPVTTGVIYGGHGAYYITTPNLANYYLRIQYGGEASWTEVPSNTLQGAPSGGGGGIGLVTGDETSIDVLNGNSIPLISLMAGTGDVTWPAGTTDTRLMGTDSVDSTVSSLPSISLLAPLDTPAFIGIPTAPTPGMGDNSTTIATTAYVQSAIDGPVNLSSIGGNYTVGLSDSNTELEFVNTSTANVTIPPNSTTAFPVGSAIGFRQMNIGQVVIVGGAGVSVVSANGLKTRTQYSTISIIQSNTTDLWVVSGDSTP